jgi:hypothetical protein
MLFFDGNSQVGIIGTVIAAISPNIERTEHLSRSPRDPCDDRTAR